MALPLPAFAQSACLTRPEMLALLDERYSEKSIAGGLESSGRLIEVFVSPDGKTWSMVLTTPDGTSCIIAAGEEWLENKSKEKGL